MRKYLGTVFTVVLLSVLAFGQAAEQYLDVYIAQVKPEKRTDFDAINKKLAAANLANKGDTWIAMETVYGMGNRVTFISTRNSYAETEKGSDAFLAALQKAYGKPGADKLFQDFNQCLVSSHGELRRRRWDLSSNPPADAAAMAKIVGNARWLRTAVVRVRPGQSEAFESLLKDIKAGREKLTPPVTTLVSQSVAGQEGTVYYITTPESSMAGFDTIPPMQKVLGEEGYGKYLKTSAEVVEHVETVINHMLPELSNAPEEVAAVAPDYWRPKATVAAKAKTGEATAKASAKGMADNNSKQ